MIISKSDLPRTIWLLVIVGVLIHAFWLWHFTFYTIDYIYQTAASQSLLDGFGITTPFFDVQKQTISRFPLSVFPPGYSLLIAPFLFLCSDYWWTNYLVSIMFTLVFFCAWISIAHSLKLSLRAQLFIAAYWALLYNPLRCGYPCDITTAGLYACALLLCLTLIRSQRLKPWLAAGAGVCLGLCICFRYAYAAAVAPVLVALWIVATKRGVPAPRMVGIVFVSTCAVSVLLPLYLWTNHTVGYLAEQPDVLDPSNLHFERLVNFAPFPARFLGMGEIEQIVQIKLKWWLAQPVVSALFWLASFAIIAPVIVQFKKHWRLMMSEGSETSVAQTFFSLCGLLVLITTPCLIAYFSLRSPPWANFLQSWTYVAESRYYLPTCGFLMVCLSAKIFPGSAATQIADGALLGKWLFKLVICAAVVATLAQVRWTAWALTGHFRPDGLNGASRQDSFAIVPLVRSAVTRGQKVLYLDDNVVRRGYAMMAGAAVGEPNLATRLSPEFLRTNLVLMAMSTAEPALGLTAQNQGERIEMISMARNRQITVCRIGLSKSALNPREQKQDPGRRSQ
jgi:hypothetical protein